MKLTQAGTSSRQSTLSRIEYPELGYNAELVRCSLAIKGELSSSRYKVCGADLPPLLDAVFRGDPLLVRDQAGDFQLDGFIKVLHFNAQGLCITAK